MRKKATKTTIGRWANDMDKKLSQIDDFTEARRRLIRGCPHGEIHFCDGRVNKTAARPGTKPIEKCRYLSDGKCIRNDLFIQK